MTGASGVMGWASFNEIYKTRPEIDLKLLLRDSKKNRKMFRPYANDPRVEIIWGDLQNYEDVKRGVDGSNIVLHIGGLVSPRADPYPVETMKTNLGAANNIVKAVKEQPDPDNVKVVYIGTVAQTGDRNDPVHWGRTGDPINVAVYDHYGLSKAMAERVFAESGLKHWVSLRQTGILHAGLIYNISPIVFHIVLRGVLEWATVEDSATLMAKVCDDSVPESFWRRFYNISSGAEYRMTNYDFEEKILFALGMGHDAPKKIFEPHWFITQNFHGQWYTDADDLENILHFRHNIPVDEYFKTIKNNAPWIMNFSFLGANGIGKLAMQCIAMDKRFGTLTWIKNKDKNRMNAYFGSYEKWEKVPKKWEETDLSSPSLTPTYLDHGYDESKPIEELDIEDMKKAAQFRGGECLSETMIKGDLFTPLKWRCSFGHEFYMTPNTILKGGHWCPECDPLPWNYDKIAKANPFFAQVWRPLHNEDEDNLYNVSIYKQYDEFNLIQTKLDDSIIIENKKKNSIMKAQYGVVFIILFIVLCVVVFSAVKPIRL